MPLFPICGGMKPLPANDHDFRKALSSSDTALVAVWRHLERSPKTDLIASRRSTVADLLAQLVRGTEGRFSRVHELTRVLLVDLENARGDAASFWKAVGGFALSSKVFVRKNFDVDVGRFLDANFDRHPVFDGQHRTVAVQNYMSATKRVELVNELVAKVLKDPFSPDDGLEAMQTKLAELAEFAVRKVREASRLRLIFYFPPPSGAAPSTREMVLSFVLWTGCPPPTSDAFVAHAAPIASLKDGVSIDDFSYFGPQGPPGPAAWPNRRLAQGLRRGNSGPRRLPHGMPLLVRRNAALRGRNCQLRPRALAGACRGRMVAHVRLDSTFRPSRTATLA